METLFVTRDARLRQRENTISIQVDGRRRSLPVERIAHLILLGEADLNSRLLTLCGKHGVRVSVFDYYGNYRGAFEPIDKNPSGQIKLRQAALLMDDGRRMAMAREIVRGAAQNMLANLLYYRYRGIKELDPPVQKMRRSIARLERATETDSLMGTEGNLHQLYYSAWSMIDPSLDFTPRVRRPPNNPINCLLSFLNQMSYAVVRHEISKTHLEQAFSVLHSPGQGRASLSLDLAEPFKPVLVDRLILRMARRQMIEDNWFEVNGQVCLLSETGRRHVAEQFSALLETHYQDRPYREWIYREALGVEREVLGMAEYQSFKRRA